MARPIFRNGRVRTPQGTFFWCETGRGPTVLMLHGSWSDSHQWAPLMAPLSSQFHCIAPDLLGFGESSPLPKQAASIEAEAAGLHSYLTHLRTSPQVIVADSLGAWVAIQYCRLYPNRVQQLVLLAPEGLIHPSLNRRWHHCRWLAGAWAPRYWLVQGLGPLIRALQGDRWLKRIRRQRRQLRAYTTACWLLFQRRQQHFQAESLNDVLPQIETAIVILQPETASPTVRLTTELVQNLAPNVRVQMLLGDELSLWENSADQISALLQTDLSKAIAP